MPFQEKREKYIRVVLVHGNERLLFFSQLEWLDVCGAIQQKEAPLQEKEGKIIWSPEMTVCCP